MLNTTHASYVICYLTKFTDFNADAAEENSVQSTGIDRLAESISLV